MTKKGMQQASLAILLMVLLTACAGFIQDQKTRDRQATIDQAMRDDAFCTEEGRRFPSTGYTRCRQSLVDQREARQLYSLRLIEPERDGHRDPHHRPTTARGDFRCEERVWGDTEWIDCRTHY